MFKAQPVARCALWPTATGQGSTYKSSKIEFKENWHSLNGIKNLLRTS